MTTDQDESILAHNEIFRMMIDRSPLPVSIQDSDWRFVFANQAYCDYVGYTLKELVGRDPSTFLFPSEGLAESKLHRDWTKTRAKEEFFQPGKIRELIRRDGQRLRFRADMGHSQTDLGDDLWCGILFDLTELDQLQSDLSAFQSKANSMQIRFDSFSELSNEGMLIVDGRDESVSHANSVIREITGIEVTGEGQPLSEFLRHIEPSDLPYLRSMVSRGGSPRGTEMHVSLNHPISGKRSIRVRSFQSASPDSGTFVLMEDVTEQIRNEENRLSVEVMRRDAVISEIHHRVKNQLHGVVCVLEASLLSTDSKEDAVKAAIARTNAIASLNGLLTGDSSEVSVLHLVMQIISHAEKASGNHVRIELVYNQPEFDGISIDNNAEPIALAINDLLAQACDFSGDNKVIVRLEATQAKIVIRIACRRGVVNDGSTQRDPARIGLAKSLMHGTDSSITFSDDDGGFETILTLGPDTLGRIKNT